MRLIAIVLSALALFAFSGDVFASRHAPLVDPAPVAVPPGATESSLSKDIKRALLGRGWTITDEKPGEIESTLFLRDHVAKIHISYDLKTVRINYVDSKNLDYTTRNGTPYIHANYLSWVQNVINDLNVNMQLSLTQ